MNKKAGSHSAERPEANKSEHLTNSAHIRPRALQGLPGDEPRLTSPPCASSITAADPDRRMGGQGQ